MNILFMCVANSARSQLAEALARNIFKKNNKILLQVQSAGSKPSSLNRYAAAVLKEVGIDSSNLFSKSVDQLPADFVAKLDYVITLCAEEVCPVILSSAQKLHWPMPDPAVQQESAELQLQRFRDTRDQLQQKLEVFAATVLEHVKTLSD